MSTSLADQLRSVADFLDERPEWAETFRFSASRLMGFVYHEPQNKLAQFARDMARSGWDVTKSQDDKFYTVAASQDGYSVSLELSAGRSTVCTRTQVGTEVKKVAETTYVEKEVPVYEWDCNSSLLGSEDHEVSDATSQSG